MARKTVHVVLLREHGLLLVEPVPGAEQRTTIEQALGLKSGYSVGLVELDLPEGVSDYWIAWAEGEETDGQPTFEYRVLDGSISQNEAISHIREAGREPLKLNRSPIYSVHNPRPLDPSDDEPEPQTFIP